MSARVGLWSVPAQAALVVGRRGRLRLVLTVPCPHCQHTHLHTAAPTFSEGTRQSGCGRGRYRVVVALAERRVAA